MGEGTTGEGSKSGERQVTRKDRADAVKSDLINGRSRVRITDGMRRSLGARRTVRRSDRSQRKAS
jgi:hypothetical protein